MGHEKISLSTQNNSLKPEIKGIERSSSSLRCTLVFKGNIGTVDYTHDTLSK